MTEMCKWAKTAPPGGWQKLMESMDTIVADQEHTNLFMRYGQEANLRFNMLNIPDRADFPKCEKVFIMGAGPSFDKLPSIDDYDAFIITLPLAEALWDKYAEKGYIIDGEWDRWIPYYFYPKLMKTARFMV